MKIREAKDAEVDALVGPGFSEWWRANSPKPRTIQLATPRLPEVTFGEHRWVMPRATIPYVKPPLQIMHAEYLAARDLELADSLRKQGLLPSSILAQQVTSPAPKPLAVGQTIPTIGMSVKRKLDGRKGVITHVVHSSQGCAIDWSDGGGGTGYGWGEFEYPFMTIAGIPVFRSDSAPGHTTVAGLVASAGTKQGIIDAVTAIDNVLWCDIVEDTAAGKIHILVRQDEVFHASRSEIIDAILRTKPAGVRAVGPVHMNGAAFQFVTKAELDASIAGQPIKLWADIGRVDIQARFSIAESGRTSTAQHCAKCGNQSKHAESETSMGLCFDCFEARR